jgi:hypothetical protein
VGEGSLRREEDLLLGQLVVHVAVGEGVAPHEQRAGHHQHHDEQRAPGADENVEDLASHIVLLSLAPWS